MATTTERFAAKYEAEPNSGCWLWTGGAGQDEYGHFSYDGHLTTAHRASYQLHVGSVAKGQYVCHRCDTPSCVNPDHLFVGSPSDNLWDSVLKGRRNPQKTSLLSDAQVVEIRERRFRGASYRAISQQMHIGITTVANVVQGRYYTNVVRALSDEERRADIHTRTELRKAKDRERSRRTRERAKQRMLEDCV